MPKSGRHWQKSSKTSSPQRRGLDNIEVKTIFEAENLEELAAKLSTAHIEVEDEIPADDIPATAAQMRVYTAQSISGGTAYNVPYAFKVKELDPARLQAAVDGMVARHEILRTRFGERDGQIMQMVDDSVRCNVENLDSDDISAFVRPFDLGTAPLLRVGYFENTVLLDMHHIITDGGSMSVFLRELNELYMGRELPKVTFSVREFLSGQQMFEGPLPRLDLTSAAQSPDTQTGIDIRGWSQPDGARMDAEAMPVLTRQAALLFSPVPGVQVTAMGYIDGKLHIQTHYDNILETDNHGYVYLKNADGEVIYNSASVSFWDEAHRGSYDEAVFDVPAEGFSGYQVCGAFWTGAKLTKGSWQVTFPLEGK